MIIGLSHVAIAVPNIAEPAELLRRKFGIVIGSVTENTQQKTRLAYADLGNAPLELIEPLTNDSPHTGFLARSPNGGLHHIVFSVGDLQESLNELEKTGARMVRPAGRNVHGDLIAFLHPADTLGTLTELEGKAS